MKRSTFITTAAIASGGLLVASEVTLTGRAALAAGGDRLSAWVQITPDDVVTIMAPQAEMGQGVMTSIPMLVAEELDADWSRIKVAQSPTAPAFNHPFFGGQATGGSTSVRAFFMPARKVGAAARAMLVGAAAQSWNVPATELRTEKGVVYHDGSGKKAAYGSLAVAASSITAPTDVALKPREKWKIIGQPVPRVDALAKSTGKATFGIDVRVPGMMFAAIKHCPVVGGTVGSIDESSLAKFKFAHKVVNLKNAVAVVADRTWHARQAADALKVTWNPGSAADLNDAKITAMLKAGLTETAMVAKTAGDAPGALKTAAKVISAEYRVPYLAHATMEPMNCTASVTKDACEIWAPTQNPGFLIPMAAAMTGLPPEKVTVHTTYLGGGFGRKFGFDYPAQAIAVSQAIGKPVQILWSREEDIQHDMYRPTSLSALHAGLDANGNLVAWQQRVVSPSIVGQNPPVNAMFNLKPGQPDPSSTEGSSDKKYVIPNFLVDTVNKNTEVPVWFWRSVGNSQNAFFFESFLDEVAHAAGKDPYAFRRALLKDDRHLAVLERAATESGWGKPLAKDHGRGMAIHESFGSIVAEVAEVSVDAKNHLKVNRVTCVMDCGTVVNPDTVKAQMQSAIIYGLTAALFGEINVAKGRIAQNNFYDYQMVHMAQAPKMDVFIMPSTADPGGVGEPATPPIAPAVVNAIFAVTGKRVRTLPLTKSGFTA